MAAVIKTEVTSTNKRSLQSMICRLKQKVKELNEAGKLDEVGPIQQRLDSAQANLNVIVEQEQANKPPKPEQSEEQKAEKLAKRNAALAQLSLRKAIETANDVLANGIKQGKADEATAADLQAAVETASVHLESTDSEVTKDVTKTLREAIKGAKSNIKAANAPKVEEPAQA